MQIFDGMTAGQSLSLQYDGPVPEHLRRAAASYDATHAAKQARANARIRVKTRKLKPQTIITLMAIAMQDAWAKRGTIHRLDLLQAGLTDADIEEHRDAAFARASAREPRMMELVA